MFNLLIVALFQYIISCIHNKTKYFSKTVCQLDVIHSLINHFLIKSKTAILSKFPIVKQYEN